MVHKNIFRFFFYFFVAILVVLLSYYLVYYWTYHSQVSGTNLNLLKGDVLQLQEKEGLLADLKELGYEVGELIPIGNHRSTRYFADVLNAYDPQRVDNDEEDGAYLMTDDLGEYHFVSLDENGEILEIVELIE
jgi:hypothetical protein